MSFRDLVTKGKCEGEGRGAKRRRGDKASEGGEWGEYRRREGGGLVKSSHALRTEVNGGMIRKKMSIIDRALHHDTGIVLN